MKNIQLIIVRGHSGSGKTTKANEMAAHLGDCVVLEADKFFENTKTGEYEYDRKYIKQAHEWCQAETVRNLRSGTSVIVANTFCRKYEAQFYIDLAKELGIPLSVFECKGDYKNVHGVPPEVVQAQKDRYEEFEV